MTSGCRLRIAGIAAAASVMASAAAKDWSFSLEPTFGVRYGTVGEYVYCKGTTGNYQRLSELDWEMEPVMMYGGSASLSWKDITLSGHASGAIPGRSGSMYDSDWQNITINSDGATKTNYSISENTLTAAYTFGGQLSFTFRPLPLLTFTPLCAVDYNYYKFEARNGYGWHADAGTIGSSVGYSYNSSYATYYAKGQLCGVDYTRTELLTWIGATAGISPSAHLTCTLGFSVAPYARIQSLDKHYGNSGTAKYYYDDMSGLFSICRISAAALYKITEAAAVSVSGTWYSSYLLYGTDYQRSSDSAPWTRVASIQGASSTDYGELSLGFRYTLGF